MRLLLVAAPTAALTANAEGCLPLHMAADKGKEGAVLLLLEAAPAAVLAADAEGYLPLHLAADSESVEAVRLLLEAAPAAALTADVQGRLPVHWAANNGCAEAVCLLLEAAPTAALAADVEGWLPLEIALDQAREQTDEHARYLETARLLLQATPPDMALTALEEAGEVALPLFADLAACAALSPEQWQRMPAPCPALGTALPAVLERSEAEAALLVGCLPAEVRQRLRAAALCLGRAQRECHIELPTVLVGQVLALATGP